MGTKKLPAQTALPILSSASSSAALTAEEGTFMLFMQPREEFLETSIGQDRFHRIERVPKLVMTPGFVDEILTRMAGRSDVSSAFAAGHNVVPSRRHLPVTKFANFVHTVGPIFFQKDIHSSHAPKVSNPWLVSSTNSPPDF